MFGDLSFNRLYSKGLQVGFRRQIRLNPGTGTEASWNSITSIDLSNGIYLFSGNYQSISASSAIVNGIAISTASNDPTGACVKNGLYNSTNILFIALQIYGSGAMVACIPVSYVTTMITTPVTYYIIGVKSVNPSFIDIQITKIA